MDDLQASDPAVLGQYTLVGRVGSGGFGIVYLANDPLGNQVAIKVLRTELADDQRLRARLSREARAISAVIGSRTAKVFEVVTDGPFAYLVMEYVQGESLDTLARLDQRPEGPLLWFTALGLVEALQEIHAAGITHRDLKPSNVIIGPDGVKVVDFGISAITDEAGFTQTGTLMGSAAWLSPEQVTGANTDQRTDIFNLGLTLAFLATGQHPFGEGRPDAVMYRITAQAPDIALIPNPLRLAIQKCLQKNPADRPSLEALHSFFASGGSQSAEITLTSSSQLDSTFVVQPEAVSKAAKATAPRPIPATDPPLHRPTKKSRRKLLTGLAIACVLALGVVGILDATNAVDLGVVGAPSESNVVTTTTAPPLPTTSAPPTTIKVARTTTTTAPPPPAFKVAGYDGRKYRWNPCQVPIEVFLNPGDFLSPGQTSSLGRFLAKIALEVGEFTGIPVIYSGVTTENVTNSYRAGNEILIQIAPDGTRILEAGSYRMSSFHSWDRTKGDFREIDSYQAQWNANQKGDFFSGDNLSLTGEWLAMYTLAEAMGLSVLYDEDMTGFGVEYSQRTGEIMYWQGNRPKKPTWGAGDQLGLFLVGSTNGCF
jgi:serine/threonine protein kinase